VYNSGRSSQQRAQHAAQRAKERVHVEFSRPHGGLSRFHLREIQKVVHEFGQLLGGLTNVLELGFGIPLFALPVVHEQPREPDD
jgi:hypothetical protein